MSFDAPPDGVAGVEAGAAAGGRGLRLAHSLGVRDAGRALRDFGTYLPTQVIPAVAGFLVLPILARRLAPTELGVLTIAQTLTTLGWAATAQWLTSAIARELPASRQHGELASFSHTLRRGVALAGLLLGVFTIVLALAGMLSSAVGDNLWLIAAATGGLVLQNIATTLFASSLRPRAYAVVDVLARTGGIALGVVLVFQGHKVQGYLFGLAAASCVVGALGVVAAWPKTRGRAPQLPSHLGSWAHYGVPVSASAITIWALLLADRYLLAGLKETAAVGIYALGSAVGDKAVTIPLFAFYTAARPLLITAYERHGRPAVEELMASYTRVMLLIGLPVLAVAAAVAHPVVRLLTSGVYSHYYVNAATVVPIVALGSLVFSLALVGNTGLIIAKSTRPLIYAALIGLAVNVAANVALIPSFGITGAAVATPIGNAAFLVAAQVFASRHAAWRFPYKTLARTGAAALVGYGAARLAMLSVDGDWARLVVGFAACGLVYVAVVGALGERRGFNPAASA